MLVFQCSLTFKHMNPDKNLDSSKEQEETELVIPPEVLPGYELGDELGEGNEIPFFRYEGILDKREGIKKSMLDLEK